MNAESPRQSSFLCAPWSRIPIAPWLFSLLLLALLAAMRFYAVFGPPQARILFLIHFLVMWALPFIVLTAQGRREIGLRRQGNTASNLVLCALAGACAGFAVYAAGMALYGASPDNWCVNIHDEFQIAQLRAAMPLAAAFAAIVLPAMIFSPIGEEILFRGLLQQSFVRRWNVAVATVVNGLAFGLVHLHVHGLWHDAAGIHLRLVSGALMVLLMAGVSAVFTLCRLRTGSLYAAMIAHSACNLAMIGAIFFHYA
ncbi:MAG TPA: CPBP family intramembrane glutamic endopeptidase [Terracidiphilus sp.]|nr:CPBP family intramembrane glutamic endopeptidase [Terracidiphilus sp.]